MNKTEGKFDVASVRADFPLLQSEVNGQPLVFLDSAASSQKPVQVINAISDYYRSQHANVHRGVYQLSQKATEAFEKVRLKVASFINADSIREIIFVRGTTEGINLVASGFGRTILREGDEVLITGMEHHSNIVPWQMACEYSGAKLRVIPVTEKGELELERLDALLTSKVKILALTHISNTLGTINPVREIIEKAHQKGIPVLIDGAQAAPHLEIDVQGLDADFYTFSAHKMFGPTGIGILYGKEEWLNKLPPYQGGGEMIETVSFDGTTYNELPFKFEAGTPNIADTIGLGAAIDYLSRFDRRKIQAHENSLLQYATEQLSSRVPGFRVIGEAEKKASVLSFVVEGTHPYDIGSILDQQGVAVRTGHHCTQPLMKHLKLPGTVRASFAFYNTMEEVDALVKGVERAVKMLR